MYPDFDVLMMRRALAVAEHALYISAPNPRVGCVLVQGTTVIGEGHTQAVGQDHAEIQAIKNARKHQHSLQGATAYITLEPCSHIGRTLPCVHALIEAGISRIVAAMEDPNPLVSGSGLQALRDAGMTVHCGLLAELASELNRGFIHRMLYGKPWVRLKVAASIDGKTALQNGHSQWITDAVARQDNHTWRARACAILSGIGTVMADDPRFDVRGIDTPRQPLKVIVDSALRISENAQLLRHGLTLIVSAQAHQADKREQLQAHGVKIIERPNSQGKVDLAELMSYLGEQETNELHVEAGSNLNGALLEAGYVNELLLYLAPTVLGKGRDIFDIAPLTSLQQRYDFNFHDVTKVGESLRVLLRSSLPKEKLSSSSQKIHTV